MASRQRRSALLGSRPIRGFRTGFHPVREQRIGEPRFGIHRSVCALAALGLLLGAGAPARAERLERALLGLNGIVTAPADPVRHVLVPLEDYVEVPGFPLSGRVLGLFSGTLLATYRITGGALDIAFAPLGVIPAISPEPHYEWLVLPEDEAEPVVLGE